MDLEKYSPLHPFSSVLIYFQSALRKIHLKIDDNNNYALVIERLGVF